MLIFAILGFGIIIGWIAGWITGTESWGKRIGYGLLGSFVGGLLASLIAGDGLNLRPSGIIGSIVGAVILMLIDRAVSSRK
ncbi:MAG TPA: GlsB/YeaQ/YmgE family stress response membrane protein [Acidimicrobiales bacterium]|jgi:uncharacterized membrane protein YeaQ/YmgE (transglycosylase-associated protein family)